MKRLRPILLALVLASYAVAAHAQSIPNPLGGATTVQEVVLNVLRALLGLLGVIGVFMFIWGGYQFLLAGGNADMVKRGKATLFWASIGLVIVVGSWVLVRFIVETASNST